MHRMPNQKACFLSDLTTSLPKPEVLAKLLERVSDFFKVFVHHRFILPLFSIPLIKNKAKK